jgi:heptosyltransferase-2
MENTLIIKTGAAGDVVRTTSLLNVLSGNIYWITANKNKPLLDERPNLHVLSVEEAHQTLRNTRFSKIISLEENIDCARLASDLRTDQLTGIYFGNDTMNYTDDSAAWFDMSRVSDAGLTRANELKALNTHSYQFHIFRMIGKKFSGEPYRVFKDNSVKQKDKLIGVEKRTGRQWPNKQWWGYDELISQLKKEGIPVKIFSQKADVRDYMRDIAECSYIVSGDTLAMHLALAYGKHCTAIFNCTSPQEIYDYGLLKKVVSSLLDRFFYSSSYDPEVVNSVTVSEVYSTVER